VLQDKQADVVHLHGYGATTFGRMCAAWMGIPAILHEHANHTDTPWFQKVADKALAPYTDIAFAVSASPAEFTTRARLMPPSAPTSCASARRSMSSRGRDRRLKSPPPARTSAFPRARSPWAV
jgi:hypothetical protein